MYFAAGAAASAPPTGLVASPCTRYTSAPADTRGGLPTLPTDRARIVVEVDGKPHYTDERGTASPQRYAEMVREDCAIRLDGCEVFRFGAAELIGEAGERLIEDFFDPLVTRRSA